LAPAPSVGKGARRRRRVEDTDPAKPRDALLHVQRRVVHRPRPGCRPPPSLPINPHATAPNGGAVSRMSQPPPALRLERPSSGRRRCPPSAAPPTPRPPRAAPRLGCRPLTSVRSAPPTLSPLTAARHPGCHTPWLPSPHLRRGGALPTAGSAPALAGSGALHWRPPTLRPLMAASRPHYPPPPSSAGSARFPPPGTLHLAPAPSVFCL
jgi:hypothetical protein